jgi:magnesium-transporting ATPase (P-type)
MTGESEELIKDTFNECMARKKEFDTSGKTTTITNTAGRRTALPSPIMMSGTSVAQGEGVMMTVMVGENSSLGKIIAKLADKDNEKTPLQIKLEEIAEDIGKLGTIFAIMTFHVLMLRFIFEGLVWSEIDLFSSESADKKGCNENGCFIKYLGDWFKFAIIGIVIIVVAVPEGLPLAVMISLAFAIGQMLNDDCAVKKLASCEIMGGANNICSDKTGTLTNNSMEVVSMYIGGKDITIPVKTAQDKLDLIKTDGLSAEHWKLISTSIACNVPPSHAGPTDLAMIELVTRHGEKEDCDKIRAEFHPAKEDFIRFSFTSIRKRMTTVTKGHGVDEYDRRAQIKGASEHVIKTCTHYIDSNGDRQTKNDEMST